VQTTGDLDRIIHHDVDEIPVGAYRDFVRAAAKRNRRDDGLGHLLPVAVDLVGDGNSRPQSGARWALQ
jgi:hypothetical protein